MKTVRLLMQHGFEQLLIHFSDGAVLMRRDSAVPGRTPEDQHTPAPPKPPAQAPGLDERTSEDAPPYSNRPRCSCNAARRDNTNKPPRQGT
jgi:hypothetical protein